MADTDNGDLGSPAPAAPQVLQVSVVIPAYNRMHSLKDTLAGLAAQTLDPASFEVIVVDNASTDGTGAALQALLASFPFQLRIEAVTGKNQGPARARNLGVERAHAPIIAFTDSDCRPAPDWLAQALPGFADPQVAFVSGIVAFKPEQLGQVRFLSRKTVTADFEHPTYPTANVLFRRARFVEFGGFSEHLSFPNMFGMTIEAADTDLAWRLKEAGWRNVFIASALVYHEVQNIGPRDWLLEPLRLFLVPALVKLHPGLRESLLSHGLFFYPRSMFYNLALVLFFATLALKPSALLLLAPLLLGAAIVKERSLHPVRLGARVGMIVANAARMYVMSFALLYGSARFRTLVL